MEIMQDERGRLVGPIGYNKPSVQQTALLGRVAEALLASAKANVRVRVRYILNFEDCSNDGDREVTAIFRSVVSPDTVGFAALPWGREDELWLTDISEYFIPLRDIFDFEVVA